MLSPFFIIKSKLNKNKTEFFNAVKVPKRSQIWRGNSRNRVFFKISSRNDLLRQKFVKYVKAKQLPIRACVRIYGKVHEVAAKTDRQDFKVQWVEEAEIFVRDCNEADICADHEVQLRNKDRTVQAKKQLSSEFSID